MKKKHWWGGLDEKKSLGVGSEIVSVPPPHVFLNGIALTWKSSH